MWPSRRGNRSLLRSGARSRRYFSLFDDAKFEDAIGVNVVWLKSRTPPEGGSPPPTHNDVFNFWVNPKPFQVFDSLCDKIGLLGPLSAEIVGFYGQGKALVTHLSMLRDIREKLLVGKTITREALHDQTLLAAQQYRKFREAGEPVVRVLAEHEHRRWLSPLWRWLSRFWQEVS
jgi:hypothetical protein